MNKSQLLCVSLQPRCQECGRFLAEETHFVGATKEKARKGLVVTHSCFCANCAMRHPAESLQRVAQKEIPPRESNPRHRDRLFGSRQLFLRLCQENHLEFSDVGVSSGGHS